MAEKQFYEYEAECGAALKNPRHHFRNMIQAAGILTVPLNLAEANSLYSHPYDIYKDEETDSYVWVIGGDAHCHVGEKTAVYKEGVVFHCKPEDKEGLMRKIARMA